MAGALQEDAGSLGIGIAVCMMLDGTYEPPKELEEYTKNMIKQFRKKLQGYET
jgi:hypothetical protein